ncbi:hypothetical protein Lalb_Chr23g0269281 [Lupinus albus]|uniref:Uncharacterized protein n=1 Tax=Lupinus albus TaxID=3870 RepID=A0A6A4NE87_LUPAL|nr:hypothetical protein Lalb_Chr23g0269281 [Lupinus albus]
MATMWNTYIGNWVSFPPSIPTTPIRHKHVKPLHCAPFHQQVEGGEGSIMCEPCNGKGWLICEFCKGQKTNVKADNNRFYRRCPSCRSVGYVLCSSCKVFKCVTFPNFNDTINS